MPNYQNGKIYAIRSYQTNDIYIGSTVQPLYKRLHSHKRDYKSHQNGKCNYVTSFEIVKYEDCYIELLEQCPCENKAQLEKSEGELIRANTCVNKCIPGRTPAEYYQDHKERIKQYRQDHKEAIKQKDKQYYQDHKEKIKAHKSEKINCICGSKYRRDSKPDHMKTKRHQRHIEQSNNN